MAEGGLIVTITKSCNSGNSSKLVTRDALDTTFSDNPAGHH